jgi:hypothetical protein
MNLLWGETRAVVSQLMCHQVQSELPEPESDILPYGTPKRHTFFEFFILYSWS